MKLARPVLALALGASFVITGQTYAVAAAPCKIISDKAGDAFFAEGAGPTSKALDITSADVASDKKKTSVAIRVAKLAASEPSFSPSGLRWNYTFRQGSHKITFTAQADATGAVSYGASHRADGAPRGTIYPGGVTGFFDTKKQEIRMTAANSLFAGQIKLKPGTVLNEMAADAGRLIAVQDKTPGGRVNGGGTVVALNAAPNDLATTTKSYTAGKKSCLVPK